MISQVAHWYSGTDTDHQYWFPRLDLYSNAGGCGFDDPVWQFINVLINLLCRICLPLYIFYAEEVEPLFFAPPLELSRTINDKAVKNDTPKETERYLGTPLIL